MVKADVTIPAGIRVFKFASLDKKDVTVKQGEVSVTLKETEVDEQVWKVNVELAYPGEGPVFDSYRQGLFNNRLWLQRAGWLSVRATTAVSRTRATTAASSASNTSSWMLPVSHRNTSLSTRPPAK